jgi:hypothetical protein
MNHVQFSAFHTLSTTSKRSEIRELLFTANSLAGYEEPRLFFNTAVPQDYCQEMYIHKFSQEAPDCWQLLVVNPRAPEQRLQRLTRWDDIIDFDGKIFQGNGSLELPEEKIRFLGADEQAYLSGLIPG